MAPPAPRPPRPGTPRTPARRRPLTAALGRVLVPPVPRLRAAAAARRGLLLLPVLQLLLEQRQWRVVLGGQGARVWPGGQDPQQQQHQDAPGSGRSTAPTVAAAAAAGRCHLPSRRMCGGPRRALRRPSLNPRRAGGPWHEGGRRGVTFPDGSCSPNSARLGRLFRYWDYASQQAPRCAGFPVWRLSFSPAQNRKFWAAVAWKWALVGGVGYDRERGPRKGWQRAKGTRMGWQRLLLLLLPWAPASTGASNATKRLVSCTETITTACWR